MPGLLSKRLIYIQVLAQGNQLRRRSSGPREKLATKKREREEAEAKSAANKQRRAEAVEQKIIDAHKKKEDTAAQIAAEKDVAHVLKLTGCWASTNSFIKGSDLKSFLKLQRKHLACRENFSASLKKDPAFSFIEKAITEDPDREWETLQ